MRSLVSKRWKSNWIWLWAMCEKEMEDNGTRIEGEAEDTGFCVSLVRVWCGRSSWSFQTTVS